MANFTVIDPETHEVIYLKEGKLLVKNGDFWILKFEDKNGEN